MIKHLLPLVIFLIFLNCNYCSAQYYSDLVIYSPYLSNTLGLKKSKDLNLGLSKGLNTNTKLQSINLVYAYNSNIGIKASFNFSNKNRKIENFANSPKMGSFGLGYYKFIKKKESSNYESGLAFNAFIEYSFFKIDKQFINYGFINEQRIKYMETKMDKISISSGIQYSTQKIFNVNYLIGFSLLNFNKIKRHFETDDNFFRVIEHIETNKFKPVFEQSLVVHFGGPLLRYFVGFSSILPLYNAKDTTLEFNQISDNNILTAGLIFEVDKIQNLFKKKT